MNLSDEIRKQIEKNKGLKLAVGEINNHLSILENLVRKDIMEQVDEAYQKGLEEGKKAFDSLDSERNSEYQRGLEDGNDIGYKDGVEDGRNEAWEAAKKIALMDTETSENVTGYFGLFRIMENLTPMQALEKLKAYEEKQKAEDKIEVGDEVKHKEYKNRFVVTKMQDEHVYGISKDGSWNNFRNDGSIVKTGRHFDIASILEDMRND